jgi:alpha-beta hydrolase superfamily lysophospholipase
MLPLILVIFVFYVVLPIYRVYHFVRPPRLPLPSVNPREYGLNGREVVFESRDGLKLCGWYVPSKNRAAVILVHGYGGNRLAMVNHAKTLAGHGYGVLLYDMRAHGNSEGRLFAAGWDAAEDVLGALAFLRVRARVERLRIGALGVSVGGQVVIRAAAQTDELRAVVADGPDFSTLKDVQPPTTLRSWLLLPVNWLYDRSMTWHTGLSAPAPLVEALRDVAPRAVLLISTGRGSEQRVARKLYDAAGEPKTLWEIPGAHHASAWLTHPEEYAAKIVTFFDQALLAPD